MSQLLDKAKNFIAEKVADMPKPEANITDVDFKDVTRQSVEYLAKVNVSNPYSTSIPICEIKYSFKSANRFVFLSSSSLILVLIYIRVKWFLYLRV
uniref:Uncharacterized protein n=1 Tax=Medicago truncatula TaxID=3880 RepID=B7FGS3_MEDTR|nr:unknown [Medicago truncatula]AFK49576.1 unknown [Medicago truncatula]